MKVDLLRASLNGGEWRWLTPVQVGSLGLRCGAQDWARDDDGKPIIYGTCQLEQDHEDRFHREWRGGKVWAEWSGSADERTSVLDSGRGK